MADQAINGEDQQVLDAALSCVPRGSYLMTAAHEGARSGLIVHSIQRCGEDPVMLCVAAEKGHAIDPLIRDARMFALGVMGAEDALLRRRFSMRVNGEAGPSVHVYASDPFDAIEHTTLESGAPMPTRCGTWFDCELSRRVDLDNEVELFVGRVVWVLHEGARARVPDQE